MLKPRTFGILAAVLLTFAASARAQAPEAVSRRAQAARGEKLTIALIPEDHTQGNEWTKPYLTAAFEDKLLAAGRFRVLSRTELAAILKEQRLSATGFVDPASAVKIGKAASASYVVVVKQLGYVRQKSAFAAEQVTVNVQAQVIDTVSSELIHSKSYSDKIKLEGNWQGVLRDPKTTTAPPPDKPYRAAVDKIAEDFTQELATMVPIDAIIAAVSGPRIAISGGGELGIREGVEFEVIDEGEPIKVGDKILGYDSKKIGRLRVTK